MELTGGPSRAAPLATVAIGHPRVGGPTPRAGGRRGMYPPAVAPPEPPLRLDGPDGGVVTLTLDRPSKRNALSLALRDAVSDALDALAARDDVRVAVITGAGETFCAGFDLREFERAGSEPDFGPLLWASADRFHRTVAHFPLPLVAAVNGPALAGGFDLAVFCDVRVAAATARFAHPELAFIEALYTPLHDVVGGGIARDLCLTGRSVDAAEALRIGLVSAVVDAADVVEEARRFAGLIAAAPREVLVRMKAKIVDRAALARELSPGA